MTKSLRILSLVVALLSVSFFTQAQYNTLRIPDTLSGKYFNLNIKDTFAQFLPGNQTITGGINGNFWGPTLFFNKGDTVHMNVRSYLNDSTTLHWHGMHLPAVMDGGPHQIIPPGTVWQPYWKVTNNAGLYWFHPHLHEMTMEQITKGIGGLIIVRDAVEAALPLPRTYGVDDIPLVLTDRTFTAQNQFSVEPFGDTMLVNGTLHPQVAVPAQVVRLRILNGAIERSYNLGFSDNRTFYVITTDGGLVDNPVPLTRLLLSPGERVEILVNCTGQQSTTVNLRAFNSTLTQNIAGGENFPNGPFANALGRRDFDIIRLSIGTPTSSPITTVPATLTTNNYFSESSANLTRTIPITDSLPPGGPGGGGPVFILERRLFNIDYINHEVPLNNTEIWELKSTSTFAHPFHIHDVQFYILTINGAAPPAEQKGWKDVILVKAQQTIRFIAKFEDYADATHPFMYHCHIALHEDEGMMAQFIVTDQSTGIKAETIATDFTLYPNPANSKLFIRLSDESTEVYYVKVVDLAGRTLMMLPKPELETGMDISWLSPGTYFIQLTDRKTKSVSTRTFVKL